MERRLPVGWCSGAWPTSLGRLRESPSRVHLLGPSDPMPTSATKGWWRLIRRVPANTPFAGEGSRKVRIRLDSQHDLWALG